jgi:hypothetical protein
MPEPCYCRNGVTLYHGDCLELLPLLAANAVITDPPYGIGYRNRRGDICPHKQFAGELEGDRSDVGQKVIDYCRGRGWPVCAFADHRRPWQGQWRQWLVWDKGPAVGGGGDSQTCWKFTWELVQVGGFGKLNGQRDSAVLRYWIGQKDMPFHPTQKPLPLMRYLIGKLTSPGDTILDPFAGSGTTLMAAREMGRQAIGIEVDEGYCEATRRRLAQEVFQWA